MDKEIQSLTREIQALSVPTAIGRSEIIVQAAWHAGIDYNLVRNAAIRALRADKKELGGNEWTT